MAKKKSNQDSPFDDLKEGSLRRQLGIKKDDKIPRMLLRKIMKAKVGDVVEGKKITALLKKRANFALNFGK